MALIPDAHKSISLKTLFKSYLLVYWVSKNTIWPIKIELIEFGSRSTLTCRTVEFEFEVFIKYLDMVSEHIVWVCWVDHRR